ncbi:MAG: GTPase HflX [Candidatus Omnitrophica bacterium]|nr:GTPase HflX [Candidatus Omnitrophota bacterium]MBD3269672.1 GTPase HflX [Candidatus Omnitrophota bacterium]
MFETETKEKALLVVVLEQDETWSKDELASEFRSLVVSTGIAVAETVYVNLRTPRPSHYIGKGKVDEIAMLVEEFGINTVVVNNNLNFTQQRNLEDIWGVKTLDRTQLILDIFAKHARTKEGILQVELAQLQYLLPRLRGKGIMLSRLGGGIGTRGPGEKKLEVDRRKISERIGRLKQDLKEVRKQRDVMRKRREKEKIGVCSLVGYTNAGKTTLFNTISESRRITSSAPFTTLDTVTRKIVLNNSEAVLTDTVGFIYKLPPYLIEAFKATLEELHYADVLLHIIDASSVQINHLKKSVDSVLAELDLSGKPTILVFNKIDKITSEELRDLRVDYPEAAFISAVRGEGINDLKDKTYKVLFKDWIEVVVKVPFSEMKIADFLHSRYEILKHAYGEKEAVYWMRLEKQEIPFLKRKGLEVREV